MPGEPDTSGGGSGGGGGSGSGGTGSGGKAGSGGTSGTGGAGSCVAGAPSGLASLDGMNQIVQFYCGGAGCHNAGQVPNLFEGNLYTTLTTYKVAKCGNRPLVQPCRPADSALYLVVQGQCEMVDKMPKGCGMGMCVVDDDLAVIRTWIMNGAPK